MTKIERCEITGLRIDRNAPTPKSFVLSGAANAAR
jgi:hypothetical protein